MAAEKKEIKAPVFTLENGVEVDPKQSLLPIKLAGDRCLIEPIITEDDKFLSKEANIAKPVNAKEKFLRGRLMSFGGGEYGVVPPQSMEAGQIVNYWHSQAVPYTIAGKTYDLVRISDVWAWL